jgi:hypothetical protein
VLLHIVLFRPRTDLSPAARQRLAQALSAALRDIPSVRGARVGRRITHGRPYEHLMRVDYSHAALIEFDDLAGLQAYLAHPAHEQLATQFFEAFEEALMYDFEVWEGEEGIRMLEGGNNS